MELEEKRKDEGGVYVDYDLDFLDLRWRIAF